MGKFCQKLKSSLQMLTFWIGDFCHWNFNSLTIMEKLTVLNIEMACYSCEIKITDEQMSNIGNIPNLKHLSLQGLWNPSNDPEIITQRFVELIPRMNLQKLTGFYFLLECKYDLKRIHTAIIDELGTNIEHLMLACYWKKERKRLGKCRILCNVSKSMSQELVCEILTKCPNLKSLFINAFDLQPSFLLEIEQKHGITLILDEMSQESLERQKTLSSVIEMENGMNAIHIKSQDEASNLLTISQLHYKHIFTFFL